MMQQEQGQILNIYESDLALDAVTPGVCADEASWLAAVCTRRAPCAVGHDGFHGHAARWDLLRQPGLVIRTP
jgi:hypothetical protein